MAKTPVEEPKYACNEKIDGTKVYYYFNPPRPEQEDEKKKDGIKKIVIGAVLIILAIVTRVKVTFIDPVIYLTYISLGIVAIGVKTAYNFVNRWTDSVISVCFIR